MTAENPDPAATRRRLQIELRRLRETAGRSPKNAAEALSWDPAKLLRIEDGTEGIQASDLRALLHLYEVADASTVEQLLLLADVSRHLPTAGYRSVPSSTIRFWNFRSHAVRVRQLETLVVPGLLQTEDYAREVIKAYSTADLSTAEIENRVSARMDQQSMLDRDHRPELFFMVDEAALRRPVGGAEVMRKQLEHLKRQTERTRLTIQVLPFELGAHRGLCGPFQILEFEDDDLVLYLDDVTGGKTTRDMAREAREYLSVFWNLEALATAPHLFLEFADRVGDDLR